MSFLSKTGNQSKNGYMKFVPIAIFVITFFVTAYTAFSMHQTIKAGAKAHFEDEVTDSIAHMEQEMKLYDCLLHGTEGFFYGSDFVSKNEWKTYLDNVHLAEKYKGLQGVGFSIYIPKGNPSELTARYMHEVSSDKVRQNDKKDARTAIIYIEPNDWRNQRAVGFDMSAEPTRREAMLRAIDSGSSQMTSAVRLVQETSSAPQNGFLLYLPVYKSGSLPQTVEERRKNIFGFVYIAFRVKPFFGTIYNDKSNPLAFRIYDVAPSNKNKTLLYDGIYTISDNHTANPMFTSTREVKLYGETWNAFFQTEKAFENEVDTLKPFFVFLSGFVISILLYLTMRSVLLLRDKSQSIAEEMTSQYQVVTNQLQEKVRELDEINASLSNKIIEEVQKKMLAREKESETQALLASVVNSSQDAIISKDLYGNVTSWNGGAVNLFGYAPEDIVDKKMRILFPSELSREEDTILKMAADGKELCNYESRRVRKDGQVIDVSITSSPVFNESGKVVGISSIIRDITEKKKWEEELKEARQSAIAASRAKSDFLTNMSHEIRTPMNAIIGMSHLLLESNLQAKLKGFVSTIQSSANMLLSLINDILDFSKIESEKMEMETLQFNLDEMLDEIEDAFAPRIYEKNLKFVFLLDANHPTVLIGDKLRLKQILMNLIGNALKFTNEGSITLRVDVLSSGQSNVELELGIEDTGIGMTAGQIEKLFKPFEQADTSTTRVYGGTGLGLAICKNLTELMGGTIGVTSEIYKGSYFYVRIPFVCMDELPEVFRLAKDKMTNKKILFVDDHEEYAKRLVALVKFLGIHIDHFLTDNFLQNPPKNNQYDLAIVGFEAPLFDETKVLQHIIDNSLVEIKNIVVSTSSPFDIRTIALQNADIVNMMKKSISRSTLLDILLSIIDRDYYLQTISNEKGSVQQPKTALENIHILVVDDNSFNLEMMFELLSSYGAVVTTAISGHEALEIMDTNGDDFDIIFMDLQMPHMDGFETIGRIRAAGMCAIPIVALSADITKQTIEKTGDFSFDGYLSKPIEPLQLITKIVRLLGIKTEVEDAIVQPADEFSEFKAIDSMAGLRTVGGNAEAYVKLLKKFAISYQDSFKKLHEYIVNGQKEEAGILIHTLKGVAGNFGMLGLHEILKKLENTLHTIDTNKDLITANRELQRCLEDIALLPDTQKSVSNHTGSVESISPEKIKNLFDKVSSFQISAKDDVMHLSSTLSDDDIHREALQKVSALLDAYDFMSAKAIIEEMLIQTNTKDKE